MNEKGRGALPSLGVVCERWLQTTLVYAISDYMEKAVNGHKSQGK